MEYINQGCIKVTHLSTTGLLLSATLFLVILKDFKIDLKFKNLY